MTRSSQPARGISAGRQHGSTQYKAAPLLNLQQQAVITQQPYNWAADPIWDEPIPEPPDWNAISGHQQSFYKLAAIAYTIRAIADNRGVSAARLLVDWEVL